MAACVWQEASVFGVGQFRTTGGAAVTVKLALQVVVKGVQVLVTVNVTVEVPPHLSGVPGLLLESTPLHPPEKLADESQVA